MKHQIFCSHHQIRRSNSRSTSCAPSNRKNSAMTKKKQNFHRYSRCPWKLQSKTESTNRKMSPAIFRLAFSASQFPRSPIIFPSSIFSLFFIICFHIIMSQPKKCWTRMPKNRSTNEAVAEHHSNKQLSSHFMINLFDGLCQAFLFSRCRSRWQTQRLFLFFPCHYDFDCFVFRRSKRFHRKGWNVDILHCLLSLMSFW